MVALLTVTPFLPSSISVNLTDPDFGVITVGDARPVARTITVTNTGSSNVTLDALPTTSGWWELTQGANWTTAMTPGQTRTFTIRPISGLGAGTYDTTFEITGSGSVSVEIEPTFTVIRSLPSIAILAYPNAPDFGSLGVGYAQPDAQTITIMNTGSQSITLSALPTVANWTLTPGANWLTPMATGDTRTFTIRPNSGLAPGTYNPMITIAGSGGARVEIRPTLTVVGLALTSVSSNTNSPQVGTRIDATPAPSGATVTYQWYRGTTSSNVTTKIDGATDSFYTPTVADVGYYLRVVATGTGNYTGSVERILTNATLPTLPSTPTWHNPDYSNQTATSVRVSWSTVDNAATYEIRFATSAELLPTTPLITGVTGTFRDITSGLNFNMSSYIFQIRARNAAGVSDWSSSLTVLQLLSVPGNFHSTAQPSTSVTLKWDTVNGATGYLIQYRKTGSTEAWMPVAVFGQSTNTKTIDVPVPNTSYDFQIRAMSTTNGNYSLWSATHVCRTLCNAPTNLTGTLTTAGIELKWNVPIGGATSYLLQRSDNGTDWTTTIDRYTGTTFTDYSCRPGTTYYYRVFAVNSLGNSAPSNILEISTLPPPLPQAEFNAIRTQYADLNLSANWLDYNYIVISAEELSEAALRDAIKRAESNGQDNLIVLRTTATRNKIMLTEGELAIDSGKVAIISQGPEKLIIDANRESSVFNIASNYDSRTGGSDHHKWVG
jgi:hypothetical protein